MSNPQRPGSSPQRPGSVPPRPPPTPSGYGQGTPPPRPAAGSSPRQPVDLATRLDGQRGWLNELDNSLKKRSIVAMVLTCLAVGVAAAAMYIAISKNSDSDRITALETRISALEAATGAPATGTTDPGAVLPDTGTTGTTTLPPTTGTTGLTVPSD